MATSNHYQLPPTSEQKYQEKRNLMIQKKYITEEQMQVVESQYHKEYILSALLCAPKSYEGLVGLCMQAECY